MRQCQCRRFPTASILCTASSLLPRPYNLQTCLRQQHRLSGIDSQLKSPADESGVATPDTTDLRISIPIGMSGMGLRPASRIHHAAHFSSLATILPAFCAAFPDLADHTTTSLHKELSGSRREVLSVLGAAASESTVAESTPQYLGPHQPLSPRKLLQSIHQRNDRSLRSIRIRDGWRKCVRRPRRRPPQRSDRQYRRSGNKPTPHH